MTYTPQPMAVHTAMNLQNFRRGNCGRYGYAVLYDAPDFAFPNICIKRETSGAAPTVTLVNLDDTDVFALTITGSASFPLDDEGEWEMLILEAGQWAGLSSQQLGQYFYLRIEAGVLTYYTDEFTIIADEGGFPPPCGTNWAKVTWTMEGNCLVSGVTTAEPAVPVHTFPPGEVVEFFMYWETANLSRPEWEYEEKGSADAHLVFVPEFKRLQKRWNLEGAPMTERMVDALISATLSKTIKIEFSDGIVFENFSSIKVDANPDGCLFVVQFSFVTDYILKQGCC